MRAEEIINLIQHFTDAQIRCLGNRCREVPPEPRQHFLIIPLARRDVIQLRLKICGEIILDIAAEKIGQKRGHQAPLILGEQPVLILADIFAIHNRGQHRCIGRGPPDPQLLHPLHQSCLGIARRRLGVALAGKNRAIRADHRRRHATQSGFRLNQIKVILTRRVGLLFECGLKTTLLRGGGLALHNLRQTAFVFILVVTAFFIDLQKPIKQNHLTIGAQAHLTIGAANLNNSTLHPRPGHLAGNGALPDQFIQILLIAFR